MKNENVFENDAPTLEMETQTLRPGQGQQIPYANGVNYNPYLGATIHPAQAPYVQPIPGNISNFQIQPGAPFPQTPFQQAPFQQAPYQQPLTYGQPIWNYPVQPTPAGTWYPVNTMQPMPLPYATHPNQAIAPTPYTPWMQAPWTGTPQVQPTSIPYNGFPMTQPAQMVNPMYPTAGYQPVINLASGQYQPLPYQAPTGRKNGSAVKSQESDFISWFPTVNVLETDRAFKIEICVPGVARENCRIRVDKNNILRITGTRRWNQETDAVGFTRKEFNYGSFACTFLLTENLQKEKITSSCRNGILIVSIPKKEEYEADERTFSDISVN